MNNTALLYTPGWEIHPQLRPTSNELVIQKETPMPSMKQTCKPG